MLLVLLPGNHGGHVGHSGCSGRKGHAGFSVFVGHVSHACSGDQQVVSILYIMQAWNLSTNNKKLLL